MQGKCVSPKIVIQTAKDHDNLIEQLACLDTSMSEVSLIPTALNEYELALTQLEKNDPESTSKHILGMLITRDTLQTILDKGTEFSPDNLIQIDELDERLKKQQDRIIKLLKISKWRSLTKPNENNWWWYFPSRWEKYDWIWNALSITALTISLSLVVNTSSRLLTGGANPVNTLAVVGQSVLTLLAGSGALTEAGKEAYKRTLIRLHIPKEFWQELNCGLSLLLLAALYGVNASLPNWAIATNRNGIENYNNKRLESAKADFERAIAMRPDYAEARYNLGVVYEDINELDKAKTQYELAAQSDPQRYLDPITYLKANNNLGRLYILKKEYTGAVIFLKTGLDKIDSGYAKSNPDLKQVRYSLLKNLGWARLKQERYDEALGKLNDAINLDASSSAAYCLKAQAWEGKNNQEKANQQWNLCLSKNSDLSKPEEDDWYGMANLHLDPSFKKESPVKKDKENP